MARGSITGVEASNSMTLQPFGTRTKLLLCPSVYSFLRQKNRTIALLSLVALIALPCCARVLPELTSPMCTSFPASRRKMRSLTRR